MEKILISEQISSAFSKFVKAEIIPLKSYEKLDLPVNSHSDMLIFNIDNIVFCYKEYYELNKEIFSKLENDGCKIVKIENECKREYPYDISLNVLKMGKFLFGYKKYMATEIINYAEKNDYTIIDVKQGYSACSTLVLDENNAITNDKSIEKAIKSVNKEVLFISNENIVLEGYNCGFIGGASVVFDNTVYFFGNIDYLSDFEKIKEKILSLNMKYIMVLSGRVFDFGGAKIIK